MATAGALTDHILQSIDADAIRALADRFPGDRFAKYLDLPLWITKNVARARRLRLDEGRPRRVLDLGCGCGYFLFVCRALGHEVLGVDLVEPGSLLTEVNRILGVPVVAQRVTADAPLPVGFDVVTAHMITFNGHLEQPWGVAEWSRFLDQFIGATVHLEMNREPDGIMYQRGVAELFGERGGVIDERHVVFAALRARARPVPSVR